VKRIQRIAQGVAVATAVGIGAPVQRWLVEADVAITVQLVVMGALIALCLTLWREVIETRVLGLEWLRKLILERDYVEGHWIDVVTRRAINPRDPDDRYVGIVTLKPSGSDLRYGGENFAVDGAPLGYFDAQVVDVEMPVIVFVYEEDRPANAEVALRGVGRIQFVQAPSGPPQSFHGRCLDDSHWVRHTLAGRRLTAEETNSLPPAGRQRGIRAVELAAELLAEPMGAEPGP